ncbi:uncharacterized protein ACA1_362840 [Acanthamoeba castellanii str. Neff]|uniref:Uncharacterized protein n=1 Tax=Acanthamoeba castellanii (strain ATCC 30010 / Neff) TaxID=1257118 RepID=L8GFM0_ACACF|nr:uncharacterized protein ACA1_362840 [Acanthamoeba castellanii str. Neff]ELR11797.1 hypothetical protein ACA1_362840 [Acanthamoeba castellanii str. Neff]
MEYRWAKLPFFMSKWITMSVAQFEGTMGNMEASAQQTWAITMALTCHLPGIKDDAMCKSGNIKGNAAKELASNPEVSEFWSDIKDMDQLVNLINAGLFMHLTAESPPGYMVLAPDPSVYRHLKQQHYLSRQDGDTREHLIQFLQHFFIMADLTFIDLSKTEPIMDASGRAIRFKINSWDLARHKVTGWVPVSVFGNRSTFEVL